VLFGSKAYSNLGLHLGSFDPDAILPWGVKDFDKYSLNGITVTSDQMKQQILTLVMEPGAATVDQGIALGNFVKQSYGQIKVQVQLLFAQ
jgi:hypothetical protein